MEYKMDAKISCHDIHNILSCKYIQHDCNPENKNRANVENTKKKPIIRMLSISKYNYTFSKS